MLYSKYPDYFDNLTLATAAESLKGNLQEEIPFLVWLLENPASPLSIPGSIDLMGHDYIHLLLKKGFTSDDEAYVIGFTMGNDTDTRWYHLLILKIAAYWLYPSKYRFSFLQLKIFDRGVKNGTASIFKNINRLDWHKWKCVPIEKIRHELQIGLDCDL